MTRTFVTCMLLLGTGASAAQATPARDTSPSPSPTARVGSMHQAKQPKHAMLESKEAHAWAKSAHATFLKPATTSQKTTPSASADSATPTISAVAATPTTVHGGDTVRWDVHTSSNVVSVTAHVTLATLQLQRAAPGHFMLAFVIPANTPGIFHGTYNVDIIAKASDGDTATKTISMTFV